MTKINPYLNFDGNAQDALNFYKSVFGGEFAMIMRYGEMPGCEEMQLSENDKNKIMHMALPIGESDVLMASDCIESMKDGIKEGSNFSISITPDSKEEADRLFAGLAEGGKVTMPIADTFWGDYFGMLEDKFGIGWMVSYNEKYVNK